MLRTFVFTTLAAFSCCLGIACGGAPEPEATDEASRSDPPAPFAAPDPNLVPDPSWVPKSGDEAVVYSEVKSGTLLAKDLSIYASMIQALKGQDGPGIREISRGDRILPLDHMTPVRVVEPSARDAATGGVPALEVQVKAGPFADRKGFVIAAAVNRLIDKKLAAQASSAEDGGPATAAPAPPDLASEPEMLTPAAAAFQAAKKLETEGKTDAAIEAYRELIAGYPGTLEARVAGAKVKILTSK